VTSGETFAAQAGEALFGRAGGRVFAGIVIIAVVGSLLALLMHCRVCTTPWRETGLFFKGAAVLHPRFGTPARAIGIQAAIASVLVLLGHLQSDRGVLHLITVLFVGLTVGALFVLRRREGSVAAIGRRLSGDADDIPAPVVSGPTLILLGSACLAPAPASWRFCCGRSGYLRPGDNSDTRRNRSAWFERAVTDMALVLG